MSKLPFVVEPRRKPIIEQIGSEESGKIEIERRGYLSSGEKAFVQQAIGSDDSTLQIIGLSRRIASETDSTLEYAYADAVAILAGHANGEPRLKNLEIKFFDEFNALLNSLTSIQAKEKIIQAICMVKYRIDPDIDLEQVMELHPDIIDGLSELYKDEESKSIDRLVSEEKKEEIEELSGDEAVLALEKKPRTRRKES
jgi:hypothetical protein